MPDVIRRGLRLFIGLAVCNSLGFYLSQGWQDDNSQGITPCLLGTTPLFPLLGLLATLPMRLC